MENYENEALQPQEETPTEETPIREPAPQYRKRSPFADSPYEMEPLEAEWAEPAPIQPKKPKSGKGRRIGKTLLAAVLVIALVAAGCGITAASLNAYWENVTQDTLAQLNQQIQDLKEQIQDNSYTGNGNSVSGTPNAGADGALTPGQVYAQNVKSVVAISSQVTTNSYGQTSETASSGTGFIISQDGYIVTNYHVVESATRVFVFLHDGTKHLAAYVGGDEPNDVAVLKIEAQGLQSARLGSSDDLIVGDQVVAIGNPLGELTSTLTVGYVSAKDRDINTSGALINMIQTDAAINPGNSGGPLFNMKGEVVGITTAKYSGTTSSGASIEGIGFAIPIDDVAKKITDLREVGFITGAYLGIMVSDCDPNMAMYGIPMGGYVQEVTPGSCAEKAGLQAMDIILAVGEYEVGGLNDLSRAMQNFQAGDVTTLTVWRGGREIALTITLDAKPAQ